MIFCKSNRSAGKTLENIIPFIEGETFLNVYRRETSVVHIRKAKYLGYAFYRIPVENWISCAMLMTCFIYVLSENISTKYNRKII